MADKDDIITSLGVEVDGERFRYGTPEHPESVPDPDGEECLWSARVSFKFLGEQSL